MMSLEQKLLLEEKVKKTKRQKNKKFLKKTTKKI